MVFIRGAVRSPFFTRFRCRNILSLATGTGLCYSYLESIESEEKTVNKKDVMEFFDRCAPQWDAQMIKSDEIIGTILDHAEVGQGMTVLDVACGTGVMFPYYLQRGVTAVTGIDISPEMAKIAAEKYADENRVRVVCGDVEEADFPELFDRIVVYNAFPHFPDPKALIRTLAGLLKEGGRLTVAHGASREAIDNHHKGAPSKVSNGLMAADRLKKLFDPWFEVEVMISNSRMYQVSGVKRDPLVHSHEEHSHDTPATPETAMEELTALLGFMVRHNDAHAQEVSELAVQLQAMGKTHAYSQIMDAVSDFDMVNAKLDAVLKDLELEEDMDFS